jgi:WD40 repeat protein
MAPFDPYHIWLGIPITERPISKYRLLALVDFEVDRDVISAAAERQTIYLRTLQSGEHEVLVAELLNEVSQARVCLLDGKSKSRYDTQLRSDLEPAPEQDPLAFAAEELAAVVSKPTTRSRSRGGKPFWKQPWAIPAAGGGIVVLLLLMWLFGSGEEPSKSGLGQEKELQAEIAALQGKLVATGNSKVEPTVSEVVGKTSGSLELAAQADTARAAAERTIAETVNTLNGHSETVFTVTFSPDGKRIVSGSLENSPKVWDVATGQEVLSLQGHSGATVCAAFSPDGKQIASGSDDTTVKVWDAETGQEILTLKGHSERVWSVAFSPNGKRIVSGSDDKTVKVWNVQTGVEILTIKGHVDTVWSVAFSPDGKRIVSGSGDRTAKVWEADTGKVQLTFRRHVHRVLAVAFSPDGKQIVSGSEDHTVRVWGVETGQEILTLKGHSGLIRAVSFSPDGKWLVSAAYDATVRLWETQTGHQILTLKGHSRGVMSVAFSSDGKRIVSGSSDKTVKIWDLGAVANTSSSTAKSLLTNQEVKFFFTTGNGKVHHCSLASPVPEEISISTGGVKRINFVEINREKKELLLWGATGPEFPTPNNGGKQGHGVFVASDFTGANPRVLLDGSEKGISATMQYCMAFDPSTSSLYAGHHHGLARVGIVNSEAVNVGYDYPLYFYDLEIDPNRDLMFVTENHRYSGIVRSNCNGENQKRIYASEQQLFLAVDNQREILYFSVPSINVIMETNYEGANVRPLIYTENPTDVEYDGINNVLYWINGKGIYQYSIADKIAQQVIDLTDCVEKHGTVRFRSLEIFSSK